MGFQGLPCFPSAGQFRQLRELKIGDCNAEKRSCNHLRRDDTAEVIHNNIIFGNKRDEMNQVGVSWASKEQETQHDVLFAKHDHYVGISWRSFEYDTPSVSIAAAFLRNLPHYLKKIEKDAR